MPYGQLPVLEIDGQAAGQSAALGRYLARKFGLDGKDDKERVHIDVFVESIMDPLTAHRTWFRERDPARKEELLKKLTEETIPLYFGKFDKTVAANEGFTVGKSLTYSDIILAIAWDDMSLKSPTLMDAKKYPAVKALKEKVFGLPGIKEYVEKRPVTEF